jgi:nickel-dependent lactate racemase
MPGISNFEAVKEHHLHFTLQPNCYISNLETNLAYQENCRLAEMARLSFIVNCVYNSHAKVVDVVAGHFHKAHLAGAERSKENYGFRLAELADVTITSAYPYLEGPQVVKPVVSASLAATKPGGSVIIVAASKSKLPESMLAAFDAVYSGAAQKGEPAFFSPALIYVPACVARNSITMVSRDLDERSITRLGFRYADSVEEAIERESRVRPQATVNIFPIGGLLLPL